MDSILTIEEHQSPNSKQASSDEETFAEDCNSSPPIHSFDFPMGEESFKIGFDLRIHHGNINGYKIVRVDCQSKNPTFSQIFASDLLLGFTFQLCKNNAGDFLSL